MANRLVTAAAHLADVMQAHAASEVTYRRGANSVTVNAILGSQLLRTTDAKGYVKTERTDRDFIFRASDLLLSGSLVTPDRGDLVDLTQNGVTKRYEVMALGGGEAPKRYSDPHESLMRVHTKYVATL